MRGMASLEATPQMPTRQGLFSFEYDGGKEADATAYAGLPLILEALRAVIGAAAWRRLRRALGYRSAAPAG